jgi:hypothetical protein
MDESFTYTLIKRKLNPLNCRIKKIQEEFKNKRGYNIYSIYLFILAANLSISCIFPLILIDFRGIFLTYVVQGFLNWKYIDLIKPLGSFTKGAQNLLTPIYWSCRCTLRGYQLPF